MLDVSREEITDGPLASALLLLAVPLVAQNFALVAQEVIDLFWVGRLGTDAVAAVGLAAVIVALVTVPVITFFTGSQVVTAQRVGDESIEAARKVPFSAAAAAIGVAAVIGAALVAFAPWVIGLFGTSEAVAEMAVAYLTAYSLALVAIAASDTLESGFTGWGDSRAAFMVNVSAIVVNLFLDPFLILGWWVFPAWGVFGAAIATAVGYAFGAAFALWLAYRGRQGFKLTRRALVPDLGTIREVADVGWPIAVQRSGQNVARLLMVAIVSVVGGGAGIAAYHLGSRVATIAFVPASGIGQAATSVVGQNLGAENVGRARRATWLGVGVAVVGLSVFATVQWLFPETIARVFVPEIDGLELEYAVLYLQILAYGYWALGAISTVEAGFNGASRTKVSMVSTLVQYWAVRLPIATAGAFLLEMGVAAVFWGVTLSNVAAAVWLAGYYRYSTSQGMLQRAVEEARDAAPGD